MALPSREPLLAAVVFGDAGAGKSSIVNMIAGSTVAHVSSRTAECTMGASPYTVTLPNKSQIVVYDTMGVNQRNEMGVAPGKAIIDIRNLVRTLDHSLSLLIQVIRGPRMKDSTVNTYRAVYEELCQKRIPIVAVITGMEDDDSGYESWWDGNIEFFRTRGVEFADHALVTATKGKFVDERHIFEREYEASTAEVRRVVTDNISQNSKAKGLVKAFVSESGEPSIPAIRNFLVVWPPSGKRPSYQIHFDLSLPMQWQKFRDWSTDPENRTARLMEMYWFKETNIPGHEYIALRFDFALSCVWVRLERDTSSWLRVLGQKQQENARKNCHDKLKIRDDLADIIKPTDRVMASLHVTGRTSFITFLHLALLQRHLNQKVPIYDIATFNCWWYASCLWESVAYWLRLAGIEACFRVKCGNPNEQRVAENIYAVAERMTRPLDWEATIFPRNLQNAHLLIGSRAIPNMKYAERFEDVDKASQDIREYTGEQLLLEADLEVHGGGHKWGRRATTG
ncbi:hypothetical protein JAAARDRAFT_33402 [Jaapia argillacea MUCL 33604]|uniref:G domain-containing protein n=1 Tax=Jaapia argillacea MUCL 33604 TaxID=933084 RepID=A0A067PYM2_9AGAM|nr:hypothetical protein JAAARDRAFT_33402 [Jaapia argillacea MUCL 33604]